jgi:hypothetical protein
MGPFEGVSSYRLELFVLVSAEDGDAMFGELLAGRGGWLNRDGQAEHCQEHGIFELFITHSFCELFLPFLMF